MATLVSNCATVPKPIEPARKRGEWVGEYPLLNVSGHSVLVLFGLFPRIGGSVWIVTVDALVS